MKSKVTPEIQNILKTDPEIERIANIRVLSPFAYYGGKNRLAKDIYLLTPTHKTHVEVCCGSAVLTANKRLSDIEVINDINPFIANLFRTIQNKEAFSFLLKILGSKIYAKYDPDVYRQRHIQYRKIQKRYECGKSIHPIDPEIAALFFSIAVQSRRGMIERGGPHEDVDRRQISWTNKIKLLPRWHERFGNVIIENLDFRKLIKKYASPDTFFYVDPPYSDVERVTIEDYFCEFNLGHHMSLTSRLVWNQEHNGSQFLISNYASVKNLWYNKHLNYCNKYYFKSLSLAGPADEKGKRKPRTEVMWGNYEVPIHRLRRDFMPKLCRYQLTRQEINPEVVDFGCGKLDK